MEKKKCDRSRNLTGVIDFFFHHHLSVLSLLLPLLKAQQSERPPETATSLHATFYLYPVILFLRCSPSCFFVPIYHNFRTILYSFPGTSTVVICGFSPPYYRDMIALTLLSDYSHWRVKVLCSRPFSCYL